MNLFDSIINAVAKLLPTRKPEWLHTMNSVVDEINQIQEIPHPDRMLVNLMVVNQVISFTTTVRRPEAFVRVIKRKLKERLGMSSKEHNYRGYPYYIMYDRDHNILTITCGRQNRYSSAHDLALLEVIADNVDDETNAYLADCFTRVYTKLPLTAANILPPQELVPRQFRFTISDSYVADEGIQFPSPGRSYTVTFEETTDLTLVLGFMTSLLNARQRNRRSVYITNLDGIIIEPKYERYLIDYAEQCTASIIHRQSNETEVSSMIPSLGAAHLEKETPLNEQLQITQCDSGEFVYLVCYEQHRTRQPMMTDSRVTKPATFKQKENNP